MKPRQRAGSGVFRTLAHATVVPGHGRFCPRESRARPRRHRPRRPCHCAPACPWRLAGRRQRPRLCEHAERADWLLTCRSCVPTAAMRRTSPRRSAPARPARRDCVCCTAADARRLLPFARSATATRDDLEQGRLRRQRGQPLEPEGPLRFARPIRDVTYGCAERRGLQLREGYGGQTRSRPNEVHRQRTAGVLCCGRRRFDGVARPGREWVFVKRVLDGHRPAVFLANRGAGVDHTTSGRTSRLSSKSSRRTRERVC